MERNGDAVPCCKYSTLLLWAVGDEPGLSGARYRIVPYAQDAPSCPSFGLQWWRFDDNITVTAPMIGEPRDWPEVASVFRKLDSPNPP